MGDLFDALYLVSVWAIPVLIAITFHEAAHGWAAWKLGDPTAKMLGRVTFNPIKHVDPVGTMMIPGMLLVLGAPFLFGYAKPVPVDVRRLHNPRVAMMLVAAAGPAINIILACGSALLINLLPAIPGAAQPWFASVLEKSILINLVLATFNMLPIPPLDGGRIAVGLLPPSLAQPLANMERYGFFVVLFLLFLLPMLGREIGMDLNFIWRAIEFVVGTLLVAILTVFT